MTTESDKAAIATELAKKSPRPIVSVVWQSITYDVSVDEFGLTLAVATGNLPGSIPQVITVPLTAVVHCIPEIRRKAEELGILHGR